MQEAKRFQNGTMAFMALAASLMFALATSGCSKKTTNTAAASQSVPVQSASTSMPSVPTTSEVTPVSDKKQVSKKSVQGPVKKVASLLLYRDDSRGLSFAYPRHSMVRAARRSDLGTLVMQKYPMNFIEPGGTTVAVVEIPNSEQGDEDSANGFFTVRWNKDLNAEQCSQFATQVQTKQSDSDGDAPSTSKVLVRGSDYDVFDASNEQAMVKYYHRLVPEGSPEVGSQEADKSSTQAAPTSGCYEAVLAVESPGGMAQDGSASEYTDVQEQFGKLEQILTSLKIQSVQPSTPAVETAKTDVKEIPNPKQ
ncbi:MAG TPA: hypothetical protein VFQ00_03395 [Terriglobales bacterium]|nr:hypothetical protein [Terriglobales bacterium]